ncbi:hypothetical protein AJ80_04397 [Polytolypa hystricis UAMH7299]|uniref:F-box domain-containing protein n=1 Tax=Polytolypa hystricis (strain UAMH7299) TaxID=1447883 RepID=A0A2B7YBS4_POLH7|nr:hypothetical protein AJ80_04397 [Polytolypa hystricis UAMH7299]
MAKLTNLPVELREHIISFLPLTDRHTLLALCRISKDFCALAQPRLFREFSSSRPRPWRKVGTIYDTQSYGGSVPKRALIHFTHTVISRPDLASQVRYITIESFDDDDLFTAEDEEYLEPPTPEMMENFKRAIERLPLSDTNQATAWIENIMKLKITALTALLLSQTPNVKSLYVVLDSSPLDELGYLIGKKNTALSGSPSSYCSALTAVHTTCGNSKYGFRLQHITPLLRLPALETFSGEGLLGYSEYSNSGSQELSIEPGTLSISHLELYSTTRHVGGECDLRQSSIDEKCLTSLVSGCKQLKVFKYAADNPPSLSGADSMKQVNMLEIQSALHCQRHTLQKLAVDTGPCNFRTMREGGDDEYNPFTEYTRLRHLDLPFFSMVAARELPVSLEYLIIRRCDASLFRGIVKLVEGRVCPSLKMITVTYKTFEFRYFQEWAGTDRFEDACKSMTAVLQGKDITLALASRLKPSQVSGDVKAVVYIDGNGFNIKTDVTLPGVSDFADMF